MVSPIRWLKRRHELRCHAPRRNQIQAELAVFFGEAIVLNPAATKGGYDEIYEVRRATGQLFAMARVNSEFKTQNDPIGPSDPGVPLQDSGRLQREWEAYSSLAEVGLSPRPLWRCNDAIASEWLDMERASTLLATKRITPWRALELILPVIQQMHDLQITHLDLNLGNILIDAAQQRAVLIDFEFGAVEWVTQGQQQAYDYLRIVDDLLKKRRGGQSLTNDPERLKKLMDGHVSQLARDADSAFVFDKLQRLRAAVNVRHALGRIFNGIAEPALAKKAS